MVWHADQPEPRTSGMPDACSTAHARREEPRRTGEMARAYEGQRQTPERDMRKLRPRFHALIITKAGSPQWRGRWGGRRTMRGALAWGTGAGTEATSPKPVRQVLIPKKQPVKWTCPYGTGSFGLAEADTEARSRRGERFGGRGADRSVRRDFTSKTWHSARAASAAAKASAQERIGNPARGTDLAVGQTCGASYWAGRCWAMPGASVRKCSRRPRRRTCWRRLSDSWQVCSGH